MQLSPPCGCVFFPVLYYVVFEREIAPRSCVLIQFSSPLQNASRSTVFAGKGTISLIDSNAKYWSPLI